MNIEDFPVICPQKKKLRVSPLIFFISVSKKILWKDKLLRKITPLAGSIETKTAEAFAIECPDGTIKRHKSDKFTRASSTGLNVTSIATNRIARVSSTKEYNDAAIMQLTTDQHLITPMHVDARGSWLYNAWQQFLF